MPTTAKTKLRFSLSFYSSITLIILAIGVGGIGTGFALHYGVTPPEAAD